MNLDPAVSAIVNDNLDAAEKVAERLRRSIAGLTSRFPVSEADLAGDDAALVDGIDAFLKRFEQLQDLLGGQVFRGVGVMEDEEVSRLSRRALADLMEKVGVLDSADTWSQAVQLRNSLAHEYPNQPAKRAARLNQAFDAAPGLLVVLDRVLVHAGRR